MPIASAWGARPEDLTARTPAHDELPGAEEHWVRAVDVSAPPALAWRWLCQMRVAPYSYDRLDNLGRRSPQELTPGLDDLAPGQRVMTLFTITSFARDEHITVLARSRVPLVPSMAVTYLVVPEHGAGCRIVMHLLVERSTLSRNPVGQAALSALRVGDLVMARRQLLNLAELAERDARRAQAPAAARTAA